MQTLKKFTQGRNRQDPEAFNTGRSEVPVRTSQDEPMRANPETMDRLGNEPNITGTDRAAPAHEHFGHHEAGMHANDEEHKKKHHYGRDAAIIGGGALGVHELKKHHRNKHSVDTAATGSARSSAEFGQFRERDPMTDPRVMAEADNNFPGTNPRPFTSAV